MQHTVTDKQCLNVHHNLPATECALFIGTRGGGGGETGGGWINVKLFFLFLFDN